MAKFQPIKKNIKFTNYKVWYLHNQTYYDHSKKPVCSQVLWCGSKNQNKNFEYPENHEVPKSNRNINNNHDAKWLFSTLHLSNFIWIELLQFINVLDLFSR